MTGYRQARLLVLVVATLSACTQTEPPRVLPRPVVVAAPSLPPAPLTPREAFFADEEVVARDAALDRVSAELIAPYPPGVPLLVPGEQITAATLTALDRARAAGNRIAYATDPALSVFRVVRSAPDSGAEPLQTSRSADPT